MQGAIEQFLAELTGAIGNGAMVKMSLGNYKGAERHLQKIRVRPIATRKGTRLLFTYSGDGRNTAKNHDIADGVQLIGEMLGSEFFSAHLFTTANDWQLDISKKGKGRLKRSKPTFTEPASLEHDRNKQTIIDPSGSYLTALGITDENGRVRDKQRDKWRQVNRYVETLRDLIDASTPSETRELKIVDMGSGKGYLTFAAYNYFSNIRGLRVSMTGVEARGDLVEFCNEVAAACGFDGLRFVEGEIVGYDPGDVDILIALHACDTATDDAIFKGIAGKAKLIVTAPCCHKELRGQITAPLPLAGIMKHGVVSERLAETLTDGIRSLLLEQCGYSARLFEFVSTEHTPKNNMLIGIRSPDAASAGSGENETDAIKELFGIGSIRLEHLLEKS